MRKISFFWQELKATFWFIPALIILVAVILATLFVYIDSRVQISGAGFSQYLVIGSVDAARVILSTIAGAMIGVAGTVFSITLVALTLASSQLGPRLIKNFMYNRLNQVVLGTYVATFIYCLLVLNILKANEQVVFIPSFSILLAQLASLANIILLIVFIHHIAISIQADRVISDISNSLNQNIQVLFPENMGGDFREAQEEEEGEKVNLTAFKHHLELKSPRSGYLQYIASESIFNLVKDKEAVLEIYHRPGSYLVEGMNLGKLYLDLEEKEEHEAILKSLQSKIILGKTRSQQQDPEHAIHQMVEIASRALSPGVNDPFTAMACIDNLSNTLCYLAKVKLPSKYRFDDEGQLRIVTDPITYEGMLDAAFNQIRQYATESPSVVIRIMEALITIDQFNQQRRHKMAIKKHAKMVLNMARENFKEPNDLQDLEAHSKLLLKEE